MDFTREPVIESVITPREGCRLVVRSSKASGQEEFFVEAVEVVSFGSTLFFRSLERPKSFLLPCSDYELLEVREARMVLKHVNVDRAIKIAGGRPKESVPPRRQIAPSPKVEAKELRSEPLEGREEEEEEREASEGEGRPLRKREKRRHYKRRRGRDEGGREERGSDEEGSEAGSEAASPVLEEPFIEDSRGSEEGCCETRPREESEVDSMADRPEEIRAKRELVPAGSSFFQALLPPPTQLISETLLAYKQRGMLREEAQNRAREEERAERLEEPLENELEEELSADSDSQRSEREED